VPQVLSFLRYQPLDQNEDGPRLTRGRTRRVRSRWRSRTARSRQTMEVGTADAAVQRGFVGATVRLSAACGPA